MMEKTLFKKFMRRLASRAGWLAILFLLGFSSPADSKSASFKKGMKSYTKGDFDKAIVYMQKALKKNPSKAETVKIHKVIGMSFFTLGKAPEAEKAFVQCLTIDSSCTIDRNEALDEAVLPFFQDIKRRLTEAKSTGRSPTRILVQTSAKNAEIYRDGVLLGPANTSLDAAPGIAEITVKAKGYMPRRVKLAVNNMVENVYEIKLERLSRDQEDDDDGEHRRKSRDKAPPVLPEEDELGNHSGTRKRQKHSDEEHFDDSIEAKEAHDALPPPTVDRPPSSKTPAREPISLAHFLPLGIGQYSNGDILMGTFFLGSQATAAVIAIAASQDIQQANTNKVAAARRAQADPTITQEEVDAFVLSNRRFVEERQQRLGFAIGAAIGLYGFGVLHAIVTRPVVKPGRVSMEVMPSDPAGGLSLSMRIDF